MLNLLQSLLPLPGERRQPFGTADLPLAALPFFLLLLQIHLLVRYPDSKRFRMLLLPLTLIATISVPLRHTVPPEAGFACASTAGLYALRAIYWASQDSPDELLALQLGATAKKDRRELPWTVEILEFFNLRQLPCGKLASEIQFSKNSWALRRLGYGATCAVVTDIIDCITLYPRVNPHATSPDATLWNAEQSLFGAGGPYFVTCLYGLRINAAIQSWHAIMQGISVLVLRNPHMGWWMPLPIERSVWKATSLGSLWGKHWHNALKATFVSSVQRPVNRILSQHTPRRMASTLALVTVFFASGIVHELGHMAMSTVGFAQHGTMVQLRFFLLQAAAIICERTIFPQAMQKGVLGWVWTQSFLVATAMPSIDLWIRYGLQSAKARNVFLEPFVKRLLDHF